ncbi:hypothetical protein C0039_19910 [Pseudohalioglobus lutimaris]|uniref:Glycosyltransferase RgtA/B/C/D-like domain-containing protein n=2 Tax=Pseudohalioglobus lutimaris TaxID=1737061 RepID=A0A2N5WX55_9GAMM|nr:hypothetical protein C0039_19910 [Pseudohalioglobus lutimaris]
MALAAIFVLALLPRLYSAQALGWGWDGPGSFNLVNFDEGGSCRAALDGFSYSGFVGHQTIAIASALGMPPPQGVHGESALAKAYCHSAGHILVARSWSALLGALTVVIVAVLCLQLLPKKPAVAWSAATLLALSGFHISHSHSGTVDAASTLFIYSFIALLAWSLRCGSRGGLVASPVLMLFAVWTKYWVFAVFAYLALVPRRAWGEMFGGCGWARLTALVLALSAWLASVCNVAYPAYGVLPLLLLYFLLVPWRQVHRRWALAWAALPLLLWLGTLLEVVQAYTVGGLESRFGSGYAAIAENKWLRNLVNVPALLMVSLGIPACLFIPAGVRAIAHGEGDSRLWLCLLPLLAFLLFMAFLAPVTYYRHYLPLLPAAAILAAVGLHATRWGRNRWLLLVFFSWPALLAWDMVSDYHLDPRRELRPWFAQHGDARVFTSFYVNQPPAAESVLFRPEYATGDAAILRRGDYLILSENWYDTAFANELNGPLVLKQDRLIKTRPEYAQFYRQALAGEHPHLVVEQSWELAHFMPEMLLHKRWYGNVQLFVGDLRVLRVRR